MIAICDGLNLMLRIWRSILLLEQTLVNKERVMIVIRSLVLLNNLSLLMTVLRMLIWNPVIKRLRMKQGTIKWKKTHVLGGFWLSSLTVSSFKNMAPMMMMIDDEYKAPAADIMRRCAEYAKKHENESEDEKVIVVQESSDESEQFDCESIVSTYSTLDNHPGKIEAPAGARKKKLGETVSAAFSAKSPMISLRGKEKLPVDFLPNRRKATTEKLKIAVSIKPEQIKRKQHDQETKEEKKERKLAVKMERSEVRKMKKAMKELYRSETQQAQKVSAIAGPSAIRLK